MKSSSAVPAGHSSRVYQSTELPTVSVVICIYTEDRWDALTAALASLTEPPTPTEVIVVVDHHPELFQRVQDAFPEVIVVVNDGPRGLSGARNRGVATAKGDVIAFLDDDAAADTEWLHHLVMPFAEFRVVAVGGAVHPDWEAPPPRWLPEEFYWVVGCSYRGLPATRGEIRNPIGANMAFRREVFTGIGGFHASVGRIGTLPAGCEETEICIRLRQRWPDARIVYEPRAVVLHRVPRQRLTWRYFHSRCYAEGHSKAVVAELVGAGDGLASERAYTFRVLPTGALRALGHALIHADVGSGAKALAIGAGLTITSLGYVRGRMVARRQRHVSVDVLRIPFPISGQQRGIEL